jgi:hypothetical protein
LAGVLILAARLRRFLGRRTVGDNASKAHGFVRQEQLLSANGGIGHGTQVGLGLNSGKVHCEHRGDRVMLAGRATKYLEGMIEIPEA